MALETLDSTATAEQPRDGDHKHHVTAYIRQRHLTQAHQAALSADGPPAGYFHPIYITPGNAAEAVFADQDGSMLSHGDTLGPVAVQSIHNAVAAGVRYVPATGRTLVQMQPIFAELKQADAGLHDAAAFSAKYPDNLAGHAVHWAILANGALLLDAWTGKVEVLAGFEPRDLHNIGTACKEHTGTAARLAVSRITADGADRIFFETGYDNPWPTPAGSMMEPFDELTETGHKGMAYKCMAYLPDISPVQLASLARKLVRAATITSTCKPGYFEIGPAGTTKATGIAKVAEKENISPKQCAFLGDASNDEPGIEFVGLGIVLKGGEIAGKTGQHMMSTFFTNKESGGAILLNGITAGKRLAAPR